MRVVEAGALGDLPDRQRSVGKEDRTDDPLLSARQAKTKKGEPTVLERPSVSRDPVESLAEKATATAREHG